MCRDARENCSTTNEEHLLFDLLVLIRRDLNIDDPGSGLLPFGSTRQEILWNNIFQHFNYQYDYLLIGPDRLDITRTINTELLRNETSQ
jgi:hypothetical protein